MDNMDASSAAGATIEEPENEAPRHAAKREVKPGTSPETKSEHDVEESSRFSYSITARYRERATQAEDLKRAMKTWCQKDTQTMKDVETIVSNILGFKSAFIRSRECSCTMCKEVADLKEQCKRFITSKDEYAAAVEERTVAANKAAEAIKGHAEAVERLAEASKKVSEEIKEYDHDTKEHAEAIQEHAEAIQEHAQAIKEHAQAIKGNADAAEEDADALQGHAYALQEHAQAIKDHAQAVKDNTEAISERAEAEIHQARLFFIRTDTILAMAKTIAGLAKLITSCVGSIVLEAHHVVRDAGSVAVAELISTIERLTATREGLVLSRARAIAQEAESISSRQRAAKFLVGSIRTPCIDLFAATWEEDDTSDLELDKTRFDDCRSSPSRFDKLCDPPARGFDNVDFFPSLESKQVELLHHFYKHLNRIFGTASILDVNDEQYSQKIEATVAAIIGWDARKEPMDPSTTTFYVPGCAAQERLGVKPILFAIMGKMAQLLGLGPQITGEEGIPKAESRWGSCVGVDVSSSAAEYLLATLPAMFGVPMEVMPISHRKGTLGQLLLEAQNRLVKELGDQSMLFLDFGGLGIDCTLFGLELTMGSIRVVVVKLSGVGTVDVEAATERTTRLPLFDKDTREYLFGKKARDVKASFEGAEEEQQGMPSGFCLLARTIMSVQSGQGTSLKACIRGCNGSVSMRSNDGEPIMVGRYLESSRYSHVLELDVHGSDNVFIKVPKSHGMAKALGCEAEILKDLSGHLCIPELYDIDDPIKTVDIRIRCESSVLPCLPWRGLVGQPTSHKRSWESSHLKLIFNGVYGALLHAHSHGWAHLFVRPSVIITCDDPAGNGLKVMLIDWEDARHRKKLLNGFFGAPAFAHDELFGRTTKWKPRLEHDLASLAYVMVYLSLGHLSWSGFPDGNAVSDDVKKLRYDVVSDTLKPLLREWDVSPDVEEALLKAIEYRESKPRKRKRG